MNIKRYINEAFANLLSSKLRSILALLGILVGTASVVAMVLGGELATNEALKQFKTLGTDLLALSLSDAPDQEKTTGTQENITLSQVSQLATVHSDILDVAAYTQVFNPLHYNGQDINGTILGVTDGFGRITHIEMQRGRFISYLDGYGFYCVIGNQLYDAIKAVTYKDPIGQQLQIGKNYFTIVGIAKPWAENSFVYANIDNAVLIPILTSTALSKYSTISNIILRLKPDTNIDIVQQHITQFMKQHVADKRIFYRSAKELIMRMGKQNQILTVFLGLIGSISLIVGGIGVMNIMLVSVIERKREIGIRLAVGARRSHIRKLFLIEAVTLSLVGGTLGVLIGMLIAFIMALFEHWQFTFFLWPPLIGFTVSCATGVFFGYYPAYKASQLDPIQALRSD